MLTREHLYIVAEVCVEEVISLVLVYFKEMDATAGNSGFMVTITSLKY